MWLKELLFREHDCFHVLTVELRDVGQIDLRGAGGFAFGRVGAVSKVLCIHLGDHFQDSLTAFGLTLRQVGQMRDFGRDEQHGRGVLARRDAGATADTGCGTHRFLLRVMGNQRSVGLGCIPGIDGNISTRLNDAVERRSIDDQITNNRKRLGQPRFDDDRIAVLKTAHVQLAGRGTTVRTVRLTVDHHSAGSTNSFPAIVVERDGLFPFGDQLFVQDVEHFEEGHIRGNAADGIGLQTTRLLWASLSPDLQREVQVFKRKRAS